MVVPLILLVAIFCFSTFSNACSDFLLNTTIADNVISGRTMDFAVDLRTVVEIIPRHTLFQELPVYNCIDCPDYQWSSKYGFVAFNMLGLNVAADGLNEKGLSAAWLYLVATEYPTPSPTATSHNHSIPIITSVCSYLLGNYATVAEIQTALEAHEFQIAELDERIEVPVLHDTSLGRVPLHISVRDATGASLVIEFLHGKTTLYNHLNQVLTNDPPLDQQLKALAHHGFHSLPGGYTSTDRFLRLSILNHLAPRGYAHSSPSASYNLATIEQRGVSDTLHILQTVVGVPGKEATEWSVVRDHGRTKVYFQSTQNQLLRVIDLKALDFTQASSRHLIDVTTGPWAFDMTSTVQDGSNTAKTMDLPPRSEIEKVIQQILHGDGSGHLHQIKTKSKTMTMEASKIQTTFSMSGFMMGMLMGVLASVIVVQFVLTSTRRATYQRVL